MASHPEVRLAKARALSGARRRGGPGRSGTAGSGRTRFRRSSARLRLIYEELARKRPVDPDAQVLELDAKADSENGSIFSAERAWSPSRACARRCSLKWRARLAEVPIIVEAAGREELGARASIRGLSGSSRAQSRRARWRRNVPRRPASCSTPRTRRVRRSRRRGRARRRDRGHAPARDGALSADEDELEKLDSPRVSSPRLGSGRSRALADRSR